MSRIVSATIRVLVVAGAAVAIHQYVVLPWRAYGVLSLVEYRTADLARMGPSADGAPAARRNLELLDEAAGPSRTNTNFYMLYAFNQRMVGLDADAVITYTKALENADHRPEIYFSRGEAYLALKNMDAAVADFVHAARFNPYIVDELQGDLRERVARAAGLEN